MKDPPDEVQSAAARAGAVIHRQGGTCQAS